MVKEAVSVVFCVDQMPPTKFVLLKRAATKSFAPGRYTGIGGKCEPGESVEAAAERELFEETGLRLELHPFAHCIVHDRLLLGYFWAVLDTDGLPECSEGTLHWVATQKLVDYDIIPTTKRMVSEWAKRGFAPDKPFTMRVWRTQEDDVDSPVKQLIVEEGLTESRTENLVR